MKIFHIIISMIVFCFWASCKGEVQDRQATPTNSSALDDPSAEALSSAKEQLRPISLEWPFVNEQDASVVIPRHYHQSHLLPVVPGELASRRSRLEIEYEGLLRLEEKNGLYCLLPTELGAERGWISENLLDTIVSVHVEHVSGFEALKALVRDFREHARRRFIVTLHYDELIFKPPPAFLEPGTTTIHMENVPARNVLHEIMAQSDLDMQYVYWPFALDVYFYKGGERMVAQSTIRGGSAPLEMPPREERLEWRKEQEELNPQGGLPLPAQGEFGGIRENTEEKH